MLLQLHYLHTGMIASVEPECGIAMISHFKVTVE